MGWYKKLPKWLRYILYLLGMPLLGIIGLPLAFMYEVYKDAKDSWNKFD